MYASPAPSLVKPFKNSGIVGNDWLESCSVPHSMTAKTPMLTASLSWEQGGVQEPSIIYDYINKRWICYYVANNINGVGCAINTDSPLNASAWVKQNTSAPMIAATGHASAQLIDGRIYITTPIGSNLALYVCELAAPSVATFVSNVCALPASANSWGNSFLFKDDDGYYKILIEARETSSGAWKIGLVRSTSISGSYSTVQYPITSLLSGMNPGVTTQSGVHCGGPYLEKNKETGVYTLYFHGGFSSNLLPTYLFGAQSTDLLNWTALNRGMPIAKPNGPGEGDQLADIVSDVDTNGNRIFCWSALNNNAGNFTAQINCAPAVKNCTPYVGSKLAVTSQQNIYAEEWIETERYLASFTGTNGEWASVEPAAPITVTLPWACNNSRFKITHAGTVPNGTNATVTINVAGGTDKIIDKSGAEVTSWTLAIGTTVEFRCKRFIGGGSAHRCWSVIVG